MDDILIDANRFSSSLVLRKTSVMNLKHTQSMLGKIDSEAPKEGISSLYTHKHKEAKTFLQH
jgi:hypothetical protein|tara:strand:- start:99 stop:284 length:186 start_codon:yes stop_codon:yes gene_type:complete